MILAMENYELNVLLQLFLQSFYLKAYICLKYRSYARNQKIC